MSNNTYKLSDIYNEELYEEYIDSDDNFIKLLKHAVSYRPASYIRDLVNNTIESFNCNMKYSTDYKIYNIFLTTSNIVYHRKPIKGYVYCAVNESFPELIKVGATASYPTKRMKELSNTSVPSSFELEYFIRVDDCYLAEKIIHYYLSQKYNKTKEFFKCSPNKAQKYFAACGIISTLNFDKECNNTINKSYYEDWIDYEEREVPYYKLNQNIEQLIRIYGLYSVWNMIINILDDNTSNIEDIIVNFIEYNNYNHPLYELYKNINKLIEIHDEISIIMCCREIFDYNKCRIDENMYVLNDKISHYNIAIEH